MENKSSLELATSRSSGYKISSEKFLISHVFPDQVWWTGCRVIPKITSSDSCKPIHDIINYSTFICPLGSGKGREKTTEIWISWERKQLFIWNKRTFFVAFEGLSIEEKVKNTRHKL